MGDPRWNIDDNLDWQTENKFPIYVLPEDSGRQLMSQLAGYSGPLSRAPQGDRLKELYDPNSVARAYGLIGLGMFCAF